MGIDFGIWVLQEYLGMLVKNNIEFKEEYLFEFFSVIYNWD